MKFQTHHGLMSLKSMLQSTKQWFRYTTHVNTEPFNSVIIDGEGNESSIIVIGDVSSYRRGLSLDQTICISAHKRCIICFWFI